MLTGRNRNSRSLFRALAYPSLAAFGIVALACSAGKPTGGPGGDSGSDTSDGHTDGQNPGVGGNLSGGGGGSQGTGADGSGAGASDGEDFDDLIVGSGGKGMYVPPEEGEFCDSVAVSFVPKTPTVYVLVDRSSSMFDKGYWAPLKTGILGVLQELQSDVRLGFGTFTGVQNQCAGLLPGAPIALDNYAAIETAYNGLGDIRAESNNQKGETPTAAAIQSAMEVLKADESPGDRFILLVTDGDPDFCDDNYPDCYPDATISVLQRAAAEGIRTLVFGIENSDIKEAGVFDYFAQAGFGEQPNFPKYMDITPYSSQFAGACGGNPDWVAYRAAAGHAPDPATCNTPAGNNQPPEGNPDCYLPAGSYSAAGGTKTAFLSADTATLAEAVRTNLEALKSCIFDLSHSNVEVKEDKVSTGQIYVNEELIASTDWRMNDPTTLELLGAACDTWLKPEVTEFFAGFPCDALIIK